MDKYICDAAKNIIMGGLLKGGLLTAHHIKQFLEESYAKKPAGNIDDFVLDKSLTNANAKVYHNRITGQTVIVHKGTEGFTDWGNNVVYGLLGQKGYEYTKRFKAAKQAQQAVEEKYGTKNLSTLGHSQGALLAEMLGKNSREIVTLNKATRIGSNKVAPNQYDISSTGDIVSSLNPLQKQTKREIKIPKESSNPLKEHSIDILNRLDDNLLIGQGKGKGKGKPIVIQRKDFIREHNKLIPILKKGSKKQQIQEALDQQRELTKIIGQGQNKKQPRYCTPVEDIEMTF